MGAYLVRSRTIEQAAAEGMLDDVRQLVRAWQAARRLDAEPADTEAAIEAVLPSLAQRIANYDKATIHGAPRVVTEDDGFNARGCGPEPLTPREEELSPGGTG